VKILYHFRTRGTGAEAVHISGIARAFEKLGHTVVFSSPTGIDPRRTAGSNPYREPARTGFIARLSRHCPAFVFELLEIGYNIVAFFRNGSILHSEKCDAIYERHAFFLFSTALLARLRKIPLIIEVNELVGDERVRAQPLFRGITRLCDRFVFFNARVIVVVSPHLKRRIISQGVDEQKVLVLPNAVDAEDCANVADGQPMRERLHLENFVVVGFVGWFVEWHRLDLLIDAVAALASQFPKLKLLLIGDGTLREALAMQAKRTGIIERVVFAGAVPHAEIPAHIAAMDICVVPHSNEYRSPIKLFEYMAQARAVLAPRTESIVAVIRDGENGCLFEPLSSKSLRERLAELAQNDELRNTLGDQARQDVLAKYTWDKNAAAILQELS